MVDSPLKWSAAAKRFTSESEAAAKKLTDYYMKDVELQREIAAIEKSRRENMTQMNKKINYFKNLFEQIKTKIEEQANPETRNLNIVFEKYANVTTPVLTNKKESLEHMLETFESKIANFKLTMRMEFDQLESSEHLYNKDIEYLNKQIDQILQEENDNREKEEIERKEKLRQNQDRFQEDMKYKSKTGEIDRELATLGRFGGWDPRDHDVFTRVWNSLFSNMNIVVQKSRNSPRPVEGDEEVPEVDHEATADDQIEFVVQLTNSQRNTLLKKLSDVVFGKNREELLEHVVFYCKVLELTSLKKYLLGEWKKLQNNRRKSLNHDYLVEESLEDALIDEEVNGAQEDAITEEQKLREAEEKRIHAKQRIAKWKQDKVKQQQEEELEKKKSQVQERQQTLEERKRRQSELHNQLDGWKKPSPMKSKPVPSPRKAPIDPAELKRRQERDLESAKLRKEKSDQQSLKKNERERKISDMTVAGVPEVSRDPNRLLTNTKASEANKVYEEDLDAAQHRRATIGAHGAAIAMNARDLRFAGRAIPLWLRPHN